MNVGHKRNMERVGGVRGARFGAQGRSSRSSLHVPLVSLVDAAITATFMFMTIAYWQYRSFWSQVEVMSAYCPSSISGFC